jgi:hypothetical protein
MGSNSSTTKKKKKKIFLSEVKKFNKMNVAILAVTLFKTKKKKKPGKALFSGQKPFSPRFYPQFSFSCLLASLFSHPFDRKDSKDS